MSWWHYLSEQEIVCENAVSIGWDRGLGQSKQKQPVFSFLQFQWKSQACFQLVVLKYDLKPALYLSITVHTCVHLCYTCNWMAYWNV